MSIITLLHVDKELPRGFTGPELSPSIYGDGYLSVIPVYKDMEDNLEFFNLRGFWYIVGNDAYGSPLVRYSVTKNSCPELYQSQCAVSNCLQKLILDLLKKSIKVALLNIIHCSFIDFDECSIKNKTLSVGRLVEDDLQLDPYTIYEMKNESQ